MAAIDGDKRRGLWQEATVAAVATLAVVIPWRQAQCTGAAQTGKLAEKLIFPPWLAAGQERPRLNAPYFEKIKLDGDLSEWRDEWFVSVTPQNGVFDGESRPADSAADLSYRFAVAYDAEALYVAVEVTDDTIKTDSTAPGEKAARAWEDDAVEIFLDGNANHAPDARDPAGAEYRHGGEFSLVINGAATSNCSGWPNSFGDPARWSGATNWAAVKQGERKLRYEVRFAWAVLGREKLAAGDSFGFTLGVQDDDDGQGRDHALYWTGISPHCWKNENGWGEIRLDKQP